MTAKQAAARLNVELAGKRRAVTALVEFRACEQGKVATMMEAVNALVDDPDYRVVAVFDDGARFVTRFAVAAR